MAVLNQYAERFGKEYKPEIHAGIYHLPAEKGKCELAVFCAKQGYLSAVKHNELYAFGSQRLVDEAKDKAKLRREIQDAVKNGEIQMYLQFIVDKDTKEICCAEALSRWQNPREGLLNPGKYIELMYEARVIEKLDFCMLEKVCKQLEEWRRQGYEDLNISCNVARTSAAKENFFEKFREIVEKYEFSHDKLWLEITEDSLSEKDVFIRKNLIECSKMGFFIVLDDFGSGYSSLRDLCDYPIDYVKIDRMIIQKSAEPAGMKLLKGLCRLAHEMDMKVLCEGVETEEENRRTEKVSCEYIQGFYYSKVFPKEHAMEYYERYTAGLQ